MPRPVIELRVARTGAGGATAALTVELPNRDSHLAPPTAIPLDEIHLRMLQVQPDAYGDALTTMVFTAPLRTAWERALGYAEGAEAQLQVRLQLDGDDALHAIRWELLRDPVRQQPLAHSQRIGFARYLPSDHLGTVQAPAKPRLSALVAVSPAAGPGMAAVDTAGEVARAQAGLGGIPTTLLDGRDGRPAATLANLGAALRAGPTILYLVCHGKQWGDEGYLYLAEDALRPTPAKDFVAQLDNLPSRPLLVVLAACCSAGDDHAVLNAVGPQLARRGIGAVIAMQGDVPQELVAHLTPQLFSELERDGRIDLALAAARAALPADQPWWLPTLWMAVKDGALWHTPAAPIPGAGVFQVPYASNRFFRGRDVELQQLAEALLADGAGTAAVLPAIAGTGGIGKTQLASEFAHRHRDDFPGGIFWLNMAQREMIAAQVAGAGGPGGLDLPGWSGMAFDDKVAAVQRAWNEPVRRLIVFDNLEDPQLLHDWRPRGGGARVLITTRRGVWSAVMGIQPVPLQTLARPESVRLLLSPRYGAGVETALADPALAQAADTICAQVGDLPLALALAGAYLEQTPRLSPAGYSARLAEQLLAHPSLEAELEEGLPTRHAASVAATIALSYNQIAPPTESPDATGAARTQHKGGSRAAPTTPERHRHSALALRLLRRMAQLAPAPIPANLLVRLAERDPADEDQAAEVDAPLRRLAAVGLIDLLPDGEAALHRLVAAFVRDQDDDQAASAERAADGLIDEVSAINRAGYPLRGRPYLAHLIAFAEDERRTLPQEVLLHSELGYLLRSQGDLAGARPYFERALAVCEQALGPNDPATATSFNNLGALLDSQGDQAGARPYYERALAIYEQALGPIHPATALSLNNLGYLLLSQGDLAGARPYYERALAIREQTLGPIHPDTALSLNNLGSLLQSQGDLAGARPYYERALAIREQALGPTHPDTANSLNNLGYLLRSQGDLAGARPYFERALAIHEQMLGPTHPDTALSLNNLGALLHSQGDLAGARPYYERALEIREQTLGPIHPDTATSLNNLGALLWAQGNLAGARPYYERALAIFTERLGPQHPHTQIVQRNLEGLVAALGEG